MRYRVGHGLNFHIELSPATGGVWLDRGEWEALKSKGLHTELNHIFTASYQKQVRTGEYEVSLEKAFLARIGSQDFPKVAEFKKWMLDHPRRRDICCYLTEDMEHPGVHV